MSTYGCLVHDNALDGQVFNVNVLGISVRFSILQEGSDESDGFLWPATCYPDE